MRTYYFLTIFLLVSTCLPHMVMSQSSQIRSTQDSILAMLIDAKAEMQLLTILSQDPQYRDSIIIKEGNRFYTFSELDLGKLKAKAHDYSVCIIQQPDSIKRILPNRPGIRAILVIDDQK